MTTPVRPTDGNVMVGIQDPEAKVVIPQGTPSPLGKQLQYLIQNPKYLLVKTTSSKRRLTTSLLSYTLVLIFTSTSSRG